MADHEEIQNERLRTVKAEIRSLLISCPGKSVELNKFLNDYRNTVGKNLPFADFNFATPLQFLSSLKDVVQVEDAKDGARLVPLANKLTAHIDQLVKGQKKNSTRPRYRPQKQYHQHHKPNQFYGAYNYGSDTYRPPLIPIPLQAPISIPSYGFAGQQALYNWSFNQLPLPTGFTRVYCPPNYQIPRVNTNMGGKFNATFSPNQNGVATRSDEGGKNLLNIAIDKKSICNPENNTSMVAQTELHSACDAVSFKRLSSTIRSSSVDIPNSSVNKNDLTHPGSDTHQSTEHRKDVLNHTVNAEVANCLADQSLMFPQSGSVNKRSEADAEKFNTYPNFQCPQDEFPAINHSSNHCLPPTPESEDHLSKSSCTRTELPTSDGEDFKTKIWRVLEQYPDGIPSSEFMNLYESLHSSPLDLTSLGFSSLKEMVLKNEDVFLFEKSKTSNEWKLYDARLKPKERRTREMKKKWIPNKVVDNLAVLALKNPNGIVARDVLSHYKAEFSVDISPEKLDFDSIYSLLGNCDSIQLKIFPKNWLSSPQKTKLTSELNEPEFTPPKKTISPMRFLRIEYFQENECDFSFKYLPPIIPDEKLLQVKLVDVYSPALMWIQYFEDLGSLSTLMCQMNVYYDMECEDYRIPNEFIQPNLAVACWFKGKWHRALIQSAPYQGTVQVLYVDYGTRCSASLSQLRKLDKKFGQDRVYAIKASMFCLLPPKGEEWSLESCEFLFREYAEKIIFAEICSVDYQNSSLEVILYDTQSNVDINVGDLLVSEKLARYLTNPAAILTERSISRIYKYFPRWFSLSEIRTNDLNVIYKNVLLATSSQSVPVNCDMIPCCKSHVVQAMYQANSEAMSLVWEKAVRQVEEQILNNVLDQVNDFIKDMGWESLLTAESCCLDNFACEGETENNKRSNGNTRSSVITDHHLQLKQESQPGEDRSLNRPPLSQSSSMSGLAKHVNRRRERPLIPRLDLPKALRYVEAQVRGKPLTLFLYDAAVRVVLSQLFSLSNLPGLLAKKRLEMSPDVTKSALLAVSREKHPSLYHDLSRLQLVPSVGPLFIASLNDVPCIMKVIDPVGDYKTLTEEVASYVEKLNCIPAP